MASTDTAVRWNGVTYRLVATDEKAGLFDRSGALTPLTLDAPATAHGRLPKVSIDGIALALVNAARPCSCTGGIWKERASDLRARLT